MAKKDLTIIELTKDQAAKYSAAKIQTELFPRLSNRRCHQFLMQQVADGTINVPAGSIGRFTYKAVEVTGIDVTKVAGKTTPVTKLTATAYGKLTGEEVADLIKVHTTEKKASYIVQALLVKEKIKPSAHDLVFLSNGRIAVEGVVITSTRKGTDLGALVAGITIKKVSEPAEAAAA